MSLRDMFMVDVSRLDMSYVDILSWRGIFVNSFLKKFCPVDVKGVLIL